MTNFFSGEHRLTILGLEYRLLRHKGFGLLPGKRNILLETYNIIKNDVVEKKAMFYACIPLFFLYGYSTNLGQMPAAITAATAAAA